MWYYSPPGNNAISPLFLNTPPPTNAKNTPHLSKRCRSSAPAPACSLGNPIPQLAFKFARSQTSPRARLPPPSPESLKASAPRRPRTPEIILYFHPRENPINTLCLTFAFVFRLLGRFFAAADKRREERRGEEMGRRARSAFLA